MPYCNKGVINYVSTFTFRPSVLPFFPFPLLQLQTTNHGFLIPDPALTSNEVCVV